MKILNTIILGALALLVNLSSTVYAADHGDSPALRKHGSLDINDVYLFPSPTTPGNVVLIMTVSPLAGITGTTDFDSDGNYQFAVDNNGDARPDIIFTAKFGRASRSGTQSVTLTRTNGNGRNSKRIAKGINETPLTVSTGGTFFVGDVDDPFFFDLLSFRNSLQFCTPSSENFFTGFNTLALVLELPAAQLEAGGSSKFGVWARTNELITRVVRRTIVKKLSQIDRMGRPAINTVLVKKENKDLFNRSQPAGDRSRFEPDAIAIMQSLGNSASGAQTLGDILFPDILTIDLAAAAGFPNGRQLTDDVIDTELKLITANSGASDCVSNDSTFRSTFPYLGVKNP
jgi:hypothetical protein